MKSTKKYRIECERIAFCIGRWICFVNHCLWSDSSVKASDSLELESVKLTVAHRQPSPAQLIDRKIYSIFREIVIL